MRKRAKRYIVIDQHGAIVGHVKSARSRQRAQENAEYRWPGATLSKTWMKGGLFRLWLTDRGCCHLCGGAVPLTVEERDPRSPSADHIVARVDGGTRNGDNLRLAHRWCNSRRNHRDLDDMPPDAYAVLLDQASRGWPMPGAIAA